MGGATNTASLAGVTHSESTNGAGLVLLAQCARPSSDYASECPSSSVHTHRVTH